MNDKALRILIVEKLTAGLARAGITLPVIAANQPTTQGRENDGIYFFQISDDPAGWQGRSYSVAEPLLMTDTQVFETQFQVEALVADDPDSTTQLGSIDVLHVVRMVIGSMPFITDMKLNGVGIQRPSMIRTPFYTNDRDQYEMAPSFDFTLTHKKNIIQSIQSIESIDIDITQLRGP